ncbi:hypothetical protein [Piscibacillus halophilus]|uniref:hypothetical protein n=1 Tax=Piscibacillus halophilus TaxID=571933 RepID=UPI00158EFF60|nr:hypothetical protein [Piscibacillus halophilus]
MKEVKIKRFYHEDIKPGVVIVDQRGEKEIIVSHESTPKMFIDEITYIFLKKGELYGIKASGSPDTIRMTQNQLSQFDSEWNFQTEL